MDVGQNDRKELGVAYEGAEPVDGCPPPGGLPRSESHAALTEISTNDLRAEINRRELAERSAFFESLGHCRTDGCQAPIVEIKQEVVETFRSQINPWPGARTQIDGHRLEKTVTCKAGHANVDTEITFFDQPILELF